MSLRPMIALLLAAAITLAALLTWQATGGDYYTKFEVVEQVQVDVDPDDPLADAGFYEGETTIETVHRDDFRFGLLPTPNGLFDRNALSVVSVSAPMWVGAIGMAWWSRRRRCAGACDC